MADAVQTWSYSGGWNLERIFGYAVLWSPLGCVFGSRVGTTGLKPFLGLAGVEALAQVPTSEVLVGAVEAEKGQWQYYRKYPWDDMRLWTSMKLGLREKTRILCCQQEAVRLTHVLVV